MPDRTIHQVRPKKALPFRVRARAWYLKLHRWLGLGLLVLGALLGVTGSINVYHRELDRKLDPAFYERRSTAASLPLNTLLQKAREHDGSPLISMILPDAYWPTLLVHQRHPDGTVWRTSFEPATGEVLGSRNQTEALLPTIYRLHQNLLLKPYWGEQMVGIAGLLLGFSLITGWLLWWPGWSKLRKTLGKKRLVDLHATLGAVWTPVLLVVSFTGFAMAFNGVVRTAVGWVAPTEAKAPPLSVVPVEGATAVGPDEVVALARAERPSDVPLVLLVPNAKNAFWRVAMTPGGMNGTVGGLTQVFVDPWRRSVVRVRAMEKLPVGEQFMMLQFPAHNGALAGDVGRFVVFLSGWLLSGLCLSGVWIWGRKQLLQRRAEQKKRARAAATELPEAVALQA